MWEKELASATIAVAEELDTVAEARAYIESLPRVDLNEYDLRKLSKDVNADVELLRDLLEPTEELAAADAKLERLKEQLAGELKGRKVLIFSSFKDTSRYVHRQLTGPACESWRKAMGTPTIRRIDSGNHPDERGYILGLFALVANGKEVPPKEQIDILISTRAGRQCQRSLC